jgi:hypothetical protein
MEQNFNEEEDFKSFCDKTIRQFYEHELLEIEKETLLLLTYKNYYTMKKVMIISGTLSVAAFITGSLFKIMHWSFAAPLLLLAILNISFVFLPLLFVVKTREIISNRDRLLLAIGTIVGILYCLSMLSLVMHWPMKSAIWLVTLAITFFVFIPAYFFTGIRNPQTKANTIVASILLVAITGIQFTLTDLRGKTADSGYTFTKDDLANKRESSLKIINHTSVETIR